MLGITSDLRSNHNPLRPGSRGHCCFLGAVIVNLLKEHADARLCSLDLGLSATQSVLHFSSLLAGPWDVDFASIALLTDPPDVLAPGPNEDGDQGVALPIHGNHSLHLHHVGVQGAGGHPLGLVVNPQRVPDHLHSVVHLGGGAEDGDHLGVQSGSVIGQQDEGSPTGLADGHNGFAPRPNHQPNHWVPRAGLGDGYFRLGHANQFADRPLCEHHTGVEPVQPEAVVAFDGDLDAHLLCTLRHFLLHLVAVGALGQRQIHHPWLTHLLDRDHGLGRHRRSNDSGLGGCWGITFLQQAGRHRRLGPRLGGDMQPTVLGHP
mmetsp:Transcript_111985/g.194436  ORF Transcript_111985/g.194436 Transcript_111985/m.194436 type:complete len:319 (+) Transcript_111985:436-1392(+)